MNGKRAKAIRRLVEQITVGATKAQTRAAYQRAKKTYADFTIPQLNRATEACKHVD